jgi:hypothetical protein
MQLKGLRFFYTTINNLLKTEKEKKEGALTSMLSSFYCVEKYALRRLISFVLLACWFGIVLCSNALPLHLPPPMSSPAKSSLPLPAKKVASPIIQADLYAASEATTPLQPTILVLTPALGHTDKTKAFSNSADFLAKDFANALRIRLQKHYVLGYTDAVPVWQKQKLLPKAVALNNKHTTGQLLGTTEWLALANSLKTVLPGAAIDRLVMVEAEVDFSKPYQPHTKKQNFLHFLTEVKPTDALDVWLVHITVYNMNSQPYEPIYRWQYRTTLPVDRVLTAFPEVEQNRSATPWFVQASRQVETAFFKETPFEVLDDQWDVIRSAKGWKRYVKNRRVLDKQTATLKTLQQVPSQ